ncbi:pirin (plasmid) [Azospirillum argentinense]|uniref:Pirin n=3 Tax=Azospirillum TaxID=191 RepID=A0A2K1FVN4_9PROT|nr:replication protein RepA [Azospirillum argentinense]AIB16630.1 pirin [Azospirillum argentinense]EZQ02333.1 pirin [Azospirillum argentinense]MBK3803056.1 pirin [Azospirillum argentinense]PNQ96594.1 pirin [Azospirillum argentinense]QCO00346.1 pirin [Azospirillum argentinense]
MGQLHHLITQVGREQAKALQSEPKRLQLIDIATAVLEEERQELGITYSGFALTALPHRRLPDEQPWERRGHKIRLLIEPGRLPVRGGGFKLYGVPYGSRARMILLYLQTRALQTDSREVELGRSMHEWLDRMGLSVGGQTYRDIREQASRIAACNLTFAWEDANSLGFEKDSIVKGGIHFSTADSQQGTLWEDRVLLSEAFFRELKAHPVPIWEPALRHIQNNSSSIDIYIWLAYRLHVLSRPTTITWPAVFEQFGAGYSRLRDFRKRFVEALQLALAVYPDARVDVEEHGLLLHPSPPPIPERKAQQLSR